MVKDLQEVLNVFATPTAVFQNLDDNPRYGVATLFLLFIASFLTLLNLPYSQRLDYILLSERFDETVADQFAASQNNAVYVTPIGSACATTVKWLLISCAIYFSALSLGSQRISFGGIYSIVVHSEAILVLKELINTLLLNTREVDSMQRLSDLQQIFGMEVFLSRGYESPVLYAFLSSLNVFSIWYIATLALGLSIASGFGKAKSSALVVLIWLAGVLVQVAFAAIGAYSQLTGGR